MNQHTRVGIENRIVAKAVQDILSAGYSISIIDGITDGETVLNRSVSEIAIIAAMFTTDADSVIVYKTGEPKMFGWVEFVYGNDGFDVIHDYSTNLEDVLKGANALALEEEKKAED